MTKAKPISAAARWLRRWVGLTVLAVSASGCMASGPKSVGLTGIVYNYSEEGYSSVRIDGQMIGSRAPKVEPGNVSGGGSTCCFDLPVGVNEIEIFLKPSLSDGFTTTARIEKWWPDLAHYAVVHILPGRKVVMQVTPSAPLPRKDLLEAQQRALGQEEKVLFRMWSAGPIERIDGKK